jgi:hypothetical protein
MMDSDCLVTSSAEAGKHALGYSINPVHQGENSNRVNESVRCIKDSR